MQHMYNTHMQHSHATLVTGRCVKNGYHKFVDQPFDADPKAACEALATAALRAPVVGHGI